MTVISCILLLPAFVIAAAFSSVAPATAMQSELRIDAFMQAVAEAAAEDRDIAAFYRENGYHPLWTGADAESRERRAALLRAIDGVLAHGIPVSRYDVPGIMAALAGVRTERDLGRVEVQLSRLFLSYARDIQTGILVPGQIDPGIVRQVPLRDRTELLRDFSQASAASYLRKLAPQGPEYARLMREKMRFERIVANGGWGEKVQGGKLEPGDSGDRVIQLRNRLIAMGYLERTASAAYDERLRAAVSELQENHGLPVDGIAGSDTLEAVNISAARYRRHPVGLCSFLSVVAVRAELRHPDRRDLF